MSRRYRTAGNEEAYAWAMEHVYDYMEYGMVDVSSLAKSIEVSFELSRATALSIAYQVENEIAVSPRRGNSKRKFAVGVDRSFPEGTRVEFFKDVMIDGVPYEKGTTGVVTWSVPGEVGILLDEPYRHCPSGDYDPEYLEECSTVIFDDRTGTLSRLKRHVRPISKQVEETAVPSRRGSSTYRRPTPLQSIALSDDPYMRAVERADAAAKRGGLLAGLQAIKSRVRKTNNPEKLQGIHQLLNELYDEFIEIRQLMRTK